MFLGAHSSDYPEMRRRITRNTKQALLSPGKLRGRRAVEARGVGKHFAFIRSVLLLVPRTSKRGSDTWHRLMRLCSTGTAELQELCWTQGRESGSPARVTAGTCVGSTAPVLHFIFSKKKIKCIFIFQRHLPSWIWSSVSLHYTD